MLQWQHRRLVQNYSRSKTGLFGLTPTLFNIFLERIMAGALEDHKSTVSIGGRTISNLRFADDIDGLTVSELQLANLVERLDKTSSAYGMQISAEKTKLMTNNTNGIRSNTRVNGEQVETVQSFKYNWSHSH